MADVQKEKKSFLFYLDYKEHLLLLTDEERGKLLISLIEYAENGTIPILDGASKMAFSFMKLQIDRDLEKYETRCKQNKENGSKGGRPPKNEENPKEPNGYSQNPEEPKKADTEIVTGTVTKGTDTVIKKEIYKEKNFSDTLSIKVDEWIQYKKENGKSYKPIGLKSLITEIENNVNKYGETAVINTINESMANNWQGIYWDKLIKNIPQNIKGETKWNMLP